MNTPIEIYFTYDLETSGLSAKKNAICEIAISPMDNELIDLPEYHSGIIKPYDNREISDGALEHNGITRQQLAEGRESSEVFKELIDYIKSFRKTAAKIILCGHNILKFDNPFLEDFFSFHKKDLYKYVTDKDHIDTMWWARKAWNESVNYKLGTCCSNAGIELVDAHRAISDTRANKNLVKYFLKNLRGEGQLIKEEIKHREGFQF
jgi:DNA polymerase III alpha subunit (gram-positive type)